MERMENKIWTFRNRRGYRQWELAFLLNQKDTTQISRQERGMVIPDFKQVIKISYALEIEPKDLYPELVGQWKREVDQRKRELEKLKEEKEKKKL